MSIRRVVLLLPELLMFLQNAVCFLCDKKKMEGRKRGIEREWRQRSVGFGRANGSQPGPPELSDSPSNE